LYWKAKRAAASAPSISHVQHHHGAARQGGVIKRYLDPRAHAYRWMGAIKLARKGMRTPGSKLSMRTLRVAREATGA
jgi:hypothetical protein